MTIDDKRHFSQPDGPGTIWVRDFAGGQAHILCKPDENEITLTLTDAFLEMAVLHMTPQEATQLGRELMDRAIRMAVDHE